MLVCFIFDCFVCYLIFIPNLTMVARATSMLALATLMLYSDASLGICLANLGDIQLEVG